MDDLIQQECLVESQIETYKSQVHAKTGYCVIYRECSCKCDMDDRLSSMCSAEQQCNIQTSFLC